MRKNCRTIGCLVVAWVVSLVLLTTSVQAGASWSLQPGADGGLVNVLVSDGVAAVFSPGDVNFDGLVNTQDIGTVASNWLLEGPSIPGDANGDGLVNTVDIGLIGSNWGATSPGGVTGGGQQGTVPEPSTAMIFGVLAVGILLVRRCARG